MPINLRDLTVQDARELLTTTKTYDTARAFLDNDPWQDGEGWIGPSITHPDEDSIDIMSTIEDTMITHPCFEAIIGRHKDGVAGEPNWWLTPLEPPDTNPAEGEPGHDPDLPEGAELPPDQRMRDLIAEAEAFLTEWWDDKSVLTILQKVVEDNLIGERGVMRLFIPRGRQRIAEDGRAFIPTGGIVDQLKRIFPMHVPASQGAVIRDDETMDQIGIYSYTLTDVATGGETNFIELHFLDDNGNTIVEVIEEDLRISVGQTFSLFDPIPADREPQRRTAPGINLNGNLLMFQTERPPLITDSILRLHKFLSKNMTMMSRNGDLGGFLERVVLNGQKPGHWEPAGDGTRKWIRDVEHVGAGSSTHISGIVTGYDEMNRPIIATPQVQFREPVDVTTFIDSNAEAVAAMLMGCFQLHILISGDATASGESRKQAMADYEKSLKKTKMWLDKLIRWLLFTVLKLAATFAGQPNRYDSLRVVSDCKIDVGPLSSEERSAIIEEVSADPPLRSQEDGMRLLGVEDPDAMKTKIQEEAQQRASMVPDVGLEEDPENQPPLNGGQQ
jgi:hypothetical protein